jgi:PAS domain S-box-containing protein
MNPWRRSGGWKQASPVVIAAAIAGAFTLWHLATREQPLPDRPLRIGFESNPPVQIRTESGFSGLAVETVSEAAKRAGIKLNWVETGTSSDEAFRKGLVDLWPLMVSRPDRRKHLHFSEPWMHSSNVLVLREGTPNPGGGFAGRIALFKMPLHDHLVRERFPGAQLVELSTMGDIVKQVCTGAADAGFFEARVAQSELRTYPPECSSTVLRVHNIPGLTFGAGLASTFQSAAAADRIQHEIDNMFRDGALAVLIARYAYFGLDDTWASYERLAAAERWRWLTLVGSGLMLAVGIACWLVSSLRQRKREEAALRDSERRFRSLANTAPVMIVASGPDGAATFFNKTWLDFTGRAMEQELGYGWIESVHPEDRERTRADYLRCLAARGNWKIEYRLRRADGAYRHVTCTGVPSFGPDLVFGGYTASCLDLTDIRSAQEEAHERQHLESIGVLAGGIAHDFNNLLGGTLAYCDLAQMKVEERSFPNDELRQIRAGVIRGAEIVRQLMIFAGKESGTLGPVDMSSLVSEMLELLKISISKHAVLTTSVGEALPAVLGDPAQIRQVVMNLVTNASEAIGERDGMIRVLMERVRVGPGSNGVEEKKLPEGDYLRLEVSDTGCGMTPETQRRIFDPFFSTKFAGRGLGLAVVQRIVRQLGGAIHVVSSVGEGASVQVVLPGTTATARAQDISNAIPAGTGELQPETGGTVLVVEDEPTLMAAVSKMLRRRGFAVIQASDGSSALELIRADHNHIDGMLLDITLPGVSSREVLKEAERLRPGLAVILTSAYSQESVTSTFAGLPVEHFIRKPFRIDDLVSLFQNIL